MNTPADHLHECRRLIGSIVDNARFTYYREFRDWWNLLPQDQRHFFIQNADIEGEGVAVYQWHQFTPAEQQRIAEVGYRLWQAARHFPGEWIQ